MRTGGYWPCGSASGGEKHCWIFPCCSKAEAKAAAEEAGEEFDEEQEFEVEYAFTEETLPARATRRGDIWWVRGTPNDGFVDGEPRGLSVVIQ